MVTALPTYNTPMPPPDESLPTYSEDEIAAVLTDLFPQGWAGADVLQELTPEGWQRSPFVTVWHPSAEQLHQELVRMTENLARLPRRPDAPPSPPAPTLAELQAEHEEANVEVERECRELVGKCLWHVFSDNNDVVGPDGRKLDFGSMRYGGEILANLLNQQIGTQEYDYIHFYLGTVWVSDRADFTPIYRMIFRRLHQRGFDWVYHFPRLYAIDMRPLKKQLDEQKKPEWQEYDPSKALAEEEEDRQRNEELAKLRESLDEGHREAVEQAMEEPPPATVQAYYDVYGDFPEGWPPR